MGAAFLEQFAKNPDITFEALYEKYKEYITPRIRESTAHTRFHMMERHILPFFKIFRSGKESLQEPIGSTKTQNVDFWTPEEYSAFIHECRDNVEYYTFFEILYYTGMRAGELLALTLNDIDIFQSGKAFCFFVRSNV